MTRCTSHAAICAVVGIVVLASHAAHAQAPSQVTPQTFRPDQRLDEQIAPLPRAPSTAAPQGNTELTVQLGQVLLQGGFPELAQATDPLLATLRGQRVTVARITETATAIERLYSEAGYPLVRVVLPPQRLVDGGPLKLTVIDGYIEAVELDGVPERARAVVARRTATLVGRRHIKLDQIERALLVGGEVPGLKLKSTLERGSLEGGVKLILEGEHRLVSISGGTDNRLSNALGNWQLRGAVAVNSALGLGEQLYGTIGVSANLEAVAAGNSPLMIVGAGAIIPIGDEGITLNPEYTHSTTRTRGSIGIPASVGTFERYALRLRNPVILNRKESLYANFALEEIRQQIDAPDFDLTLNRDHYRVVRFGPDYATTLPWGAGLQVGALLSFGLGGRDTIEASGTVTPLSRLGADPDFRKVTGNARYSQQLPLGMRLDVIAAGQYTGGKPLLRPEQMALDGSDAISAFSSGTFNVDEGVTVRGETSRPFPVRVGATSGNVSPYLFGAYGRGWIANASAVEQPAFNAGAAGLGVRTGIESRPSLPGGSLALEVARGFTDLSGVKTGWRANLVASAAF